MTAAHVLATGHAPGKIILFGEHAVVYGRPAIAAPVTQVQAHAAIYPSAACVIDAADLGWIIPAASAPEENPFALTVRLVCAEIGQPLPPWRIHVYSDIPIASGLGSGAAIATAIIRAMLAGFGVELPAARISALVYEVEKLHHGTPSGIDNTVIAFGAPVWFVRGQPPQPFRVGAPLHVLIGDTGVASPTRIAVGDVAAAWRAQPATYERLFDQAGAIAHQARLMIEAGEITALGPLMDANQEVLQQMGVSSPELDRLCAAARTAGAAGAKLSGGGRGGNMIALAAPAQQERVTAALIAANARRVLRTEIVMEG